MILNTHLQVTLRPGALRLHPLNNTTVCHHYLFLCDSILKGQNELMMQKICAELNWSLCTYHEKEGSSCR
jgi:hypothetical protein